MTVKPSLKNLKAQIGKIANLLDDEQQSDAADAAEWPPESASLGYAGDRRPERVGEPFDERLGEPLDLETDHDSGAYDVLDDGEYADDLTEARQEPLPLMDNDAMRRVEEHMFLAEDQALRQAEEFAERQAEEYAREQLEAYQREEADFDDEAQTDYGGDDVSWVLPVTEGVSYTESTSFGEDGISFGEPLDPFAELPVSDLGTIDTLPELEGIRQIKIDGKVVRDRVVNRLVALSIITEDQVRQTLGEWERVRKDGYQVALWRLLTVNPEINRERIFAEAAAVYRFPHVRLSRQDALYFIEKVINVFPDRDMRRMLEHFVIPVGREVDRRTGESKWIMATHDPTRPEVHRMLRELNLKRFELYYASESLIKGLITDGFLSKNEYLDRLNDNPLVYDIGSEYEQQGELVDNDELEAEINRSSLINLFEATLVEAVNRGASDVHVFPNPDSQIEIHFRVDGNLEMWHREERIHPEAFLAVVKDKSKNVDRFEKDTAQDGFIQRPINDTIIRFRVSILPIASHKPGVNAESIVIRVLDDRKVLTDLAGVGMLESALARFKQAIHQPHGMIILTGPTGSGKSTTLVAALHRVITPKVNVLTIEDPVEYLIKGVRQVKLSHHLTMDGALRALLRHDPDIVMVGEMRDRETAELAIKLANTGHLTFTTLHTNDAPSAVSRLFKMGIEPFLIAYAINIVVAQRLVRQLCPDCKVSTRPNDDLLKLLGFTDKDVAEIDFKTHGDSSECATCGGQGYKGRRAVAETLYFSDEVRRLILTSGDVVDEASIREQAESEGMLSLMDSAKEVVRMGDTSIEEMMRITGS
jgi:type IV pilus assembly protein PilB